MEKMYVILSLIFTVVVNGHDSNESKYIDLLSDSEKEEFLINVARRISERVKVEENVSHKSSVEISEDDLKTHDSFVKKILIEELDNQRRNKDSTLEGKENKSNEENSINVKVKPLEKDINRLENDDIDFTVRNERIKRRDIPSEKISNIPVEVITENVEILTTNINDTKKDTQNTDQATNEENIKHKETSPVSYMEDMQLRNAQDGKTERQKDTDVKSQEDYKKKNILEREINITDNFDIEAITTLYDHTEDITTTSSADGNSTTLQNIVGLTDLMSTIKNIQIGNKRRLGAENINIRETTFKDEDMLDRENTSQNPKIEIITKEDIGNTTNITLKATNSKEDSLDHIETVTEDYKSMETTSEYTNTEVSTRENLENITNIEAFTKITFAPVSSTNTEVKILGKSIALHTGKVAQNLNQVTEIIRDRRSEQKIYLNRTDIKIEDSTSNSNLSNGGTNINLRILRSNVEDGDDNYSKNSYTNTPTGTSSTVIRNDAYPLNEEEPKKYILIEPKQTNIELESARMTNNTELNITNSYVKKNCTQNYTRLAVAEKAVNFLRESLLMLDENEDHVKNSQDEIIKDLQNEYLNIHNTNGKTYHVREIQTDQPPFTEFSLSTTEKPYRVPVYNYSHYNAYYNPKNRYEPNSDEYTSQAHNDFKMSRMKALQRTPEKFFAKFRDKLSSEDSLDNDGNQRKKFDGIVYFQGKNNNKKVKHHNHDNIDKITYYLKLPFAKPKKQKTIITYSPPLYNPYDYMDINYDFRMRKTGRSNNIIIPNSDEDSHPFNSIKNMKNHVRAVKNILYSNNIFPYPKPFEPETTTEIVQEDESSAHFRNGDGTSDIIALDYFFGRMKPQENYHQRVNSKKSNVFPQLFKKGNTSITDTNLMKYIYNNLKMKGTEYVDDYHNIAATPHADFMFEVESLKKSKLKPSLHNLHVLKKSSEIKENVEDADDKNGALNSTPKILGITDEKDVFVILQMLQKLNLSLSRRQDDNIHVFIRVLKDMVYKENNALKQYDWLGTTVDVLAALHKLLQLTEAAQKGEGMHPLDLELLKYTIFLHQLSDECLKNKGLATKLRKLLPKNRNRKPHFLTEKGLLNRVWLLRKTTGYNEEYDDLEELKQFLIGLEYGLYDLYKTMKNLAKVTEFPNQNWFEGIMGSYLRKDHKTYLNLLLHMFSTRLFGLIEESATKGMETSFMLYLKKKKNKDAAVRTVEEMVFIKKILNEIKRHE